MLTNSCHGTWFSPINKRQYGAPLTLTEKEHTLSKKCRLRDAFRYIRKHWVALCNFCDDGLAEADNNAAERALRAVCL
nr:transposase [Escherichia coli]